MLSALLVVFGVGVAAPWLTGWWGRRSGWALAVVPAAVTAFLALQWSRVGAGEVLTERFAWVPQLGVELSFKLDGLSLLFALMISGIGTLIVVYGNSYLADDPALPRFNLLLLLFMGAMLGVVLTDDLITLFVFWELTSLTSYFLVGYKHEAETSRKSALQALLVTGTGGLAMLLGFLLLGNIVGSFRISDLLAAGELLRAHPHYPVALVLVALGAFTKSAQWPFHFWLPNAMAAPTPVSAYLHSATMVKAGVYLLARLSPALAGTALWSTLLITAGAATLVAAALLSLPQRDSKRLLAYSTLIALGTLVLLLGVGTPAAIKAMVVFLLAHALYKAPLFMIAGGVDHAVHSRDVTALAGLGRTMRASWLIALVAGVSAAGLPPAFGFLAKELALEALLSTTLLLAAFVLAGAVMFWVVVQVAWRPFAGAHLRAPAEPHEAPLGMLLGPALLALLGATLGLLPGLVQNTLMRPAASAILGESATFSLYLWHGFTPALALSGLAVGLGVLLSLTTRLWFSPLERWARRLPWGPAAGYDALLLGVARLSVWQTKVVQPADLRSQLIFILAFAFSLLGGVLAFRGGLQGAWRAPQLDYLHEPLIVAIIGAGVIGALLARERIVALTSLGVVGFGIAFVFVLLSAPDLAITQFLVETLIVIVAALVLARLPGGSLRAGAGGSGRWVATLIALSGGALLSALLMGVTQGPINRSLTAFFEAQSYPMAQGRNIVNVILVDFRAIDTLGEVVVLAIAGAGVYALLRAARPNPEAGDEEPPR